MRATAATRMMVRKPGAPTFVASSGAITATVGTLTLAVNKPTGVQEGDVMVAFCHLRTVTDACAAPAGWKLVDERSISTLVRGYVFTKTATASEGSSYTWTKTGTSNLLAVAILAYRDCGGVGSYIPSTATGITTAPTALDLTTTDDNSVVIWSAFARGSGGNDAITVPTGYTQRFNNTDDRKVTIGDKTYATAGATGTAAGVNSQNVAHLLWHVQLRPQSTNWPAAATWQKTYHPTGVSPLVEARMPQRRSGPLVIYMHGRAGSEDAAWTDPGFSTVVTALQNAGCCVCSVDQGYSAWGNSTAVSALTTLLTWVATYWDATKTILMPQSMGGLSSLTAMATGVIVPNGAYMLMPVANLAYTYANPGEAGWPAEMRTSYSFSDPNFTTATAGYRPEDRVAANFPAIRYRWVASAGDTKVPKANNTDVLRAIVGAGSPIENGLVTATGLHGDASHFDSADMLAFINRC